MTFNETYLKPRHNPYFPDYQPMARADRPTRGGGVAMLVKKGISYDIADPVLTTDTTSDEQLTITIQTATETIYISTLYCPSGRPSREIIEGICKGRDNVVLTGDFNSKHESFGNKACNPGGNLLKEIIDDTNMTLINDDTPTHTSDRTGNQDILDLIFVSPPMIPHYRDFWVGHDLGSDHNTIIGVFSYTPLIDELPTKTVMLYHKADWKNINNTITNTMTNHDLNIHTSTLQDIDQYVNTLTETITNTIDDNVKSKTLKPNSVGLPQAIRDLIKEKRRLRRYWQQTRQQHYKTKYNRLDKTIKQYTRQTRQNSWTEYCNDMELAEGHNDSWRKLKSVINPRLRSEYPTLITTDQHNNITRHTTTTQKLNAFADQLTETFTNDGDTTNYDEDWKQTVDTYVNTNNQMLKALDHLEVNDQIHDGNRVLLPELESKLKHLNTKKASGHDKISNKLITYLLPSLTSILLTLYTILILRGYFPIVWKRAMGLMILKPKKKRSDPGSFRPISLLCNLGKVLESIITTRLYLWAESTNLLPPEQSGFRKNRSTNDRLFQLTQVVAQQFARRNTQYVGTIFLDVEKAFDRVWHNGLRYKLLNLNLPPLLTRWISNFLKDRVVQAFIMGKTSRDVIINHGVPQGSPLSPILYLIYTSDLPPLPPSKPQVFRSIFADDLKFFAAGPNLNLIIQTLQQSMDDLACYADMWRIGLSTDKTSKLLFRRSAQNIPNWHISIHGKAIQSVTTAKFLGITFDTTLSFTTHFQNITNIARHRLLKLLSISTPNYGPSPITTIRLFNTYIRTLFEYGGAATCVANPRRFIQWERLQMRLITKILDVPNTLKHDSLRRHADQPTIRDRVLYLAKRWYSTAYKNNAAHREFIHTYAKYYAGKTRLIPDEILKQ